MKRFRMPLELLRRVVLGVYGDRIHEVIAPDAIAEFFLQNSQTRSRQRTDIGARGEDEVDNHLLALHQVVVEVECVSILVDYRHIGKVFLTPARRLSGVREASVDLRSRRKTPKDRKARTAMYG